MLQSPKHIFAVLLLLLVVCIRKCWAYDICGNDEGKSICKKQMTKHFICDIEAQVPTAGTYLYNFPITEKVRILMLDSHNALRNYLASGTAQDSKQQSFPPARRMRTLLWDNELEYVAHVHSTRCNMYHSKCHNTRRHQFGGQNLAEKLSDDKLGSYEDINMSINAWFNEKHLPVVDAKTLYRLYIPGQEIGHFEVMIQERVSRIGCAFASCTDCLIGAPPLYKYGNYLSCQMDSTNIVNTPNYYIGRAASECSHWNTVPSKRYPYLCENSGEEFDEPRSLYKDSELDKF